MAESEDKENPLDIDNSQTLYINPYAASKLYSEKYTVPFAQQQGFNFNKSEVTKLYKFQFKAYKDFLTALGLKQLLEDDIAFFGQKYKALRDFVKVSNVVSREKHLYMVIRITGITYKYNDKSHLYAFVRCPFDGTKKYTHFSPRDWTYCKIVSSENKIVNLYNFRNFEIEMYNAFGTKYNLVTLANLDLDTLLYGRKYGKIVSKKFYMHESMRTHKLFKARFLIYVFNVLLRRITNKVPNFMKSTELGIENDYMKRVQYRYYIDSYLRRVGTAKIDICLTPDITKVDQYCQDYYKLKEKIVSAVLESPRYELLMVEFYCPHKQNGFCINGCHTIEDILSRKTFIQIYVKLKKITQGGTKIEDPEAVDMVGALINDQESPSAKNKIQYTYNGTGDIMDKALQAGRNKSYYRFQEQGDAANSANDDSKSKSAAEGRYEDRAADDDLVDNTLIKGTDAFYEGVDETSGAHTELLYDNTIMQDLHCFHDEWCSFKILDLEMKTEAMNIQFENAEIMRNKQFVFFKYLNVTGLGKVTIKFMYELQIEDQEMCMK